MELLSHPDKLLVDHLSETAKTALKTFQRKSYNFSFEIENEIVILDKIIADLIYLSTAFHDIGKATIFFQKYIRNPDELHDKRKNHALLSALFVYFSVTKFLERFSIPPAIKQLLATFCFTAVKRHHGKLNNLSNELFFEENQSLLEEQISSIAPYSIEPIITQFLKKYKIEIGWDKFFEFVYKKEYYDVFDDFSFDYLDDAYMLLPVSTRTSLFYVHQLIYSSLLFSDKNEVIIKHKTYPFQVIDILNKIKKYRIKNGFNHPDNKINKLKNQAFFESQAQLEKVFTKENHIYSVTLPTGIGKTITAFNLADKIRKLSGNNNSSIIITIPFTSIIDQNFEVYRNILGTDNSEIILKHHHLADPVYKMGEDIASYDESKFLIETWQSNVVVTTFVQLLETLFSCDKTKLMKLIHLSGSVILLDEIQTIPYPLWETIREGFKILGKRFNIYFILISATQPLIFEPKKEITELVPDYESYFKYFNRTKLIVNKEKVSFEIFKSIVSDYIVNNRSKDTLIILNTKKAAKELFQELREIVDININELYFLTTLITPFERKQIIKRIKKESNKRKVIVSTQLVEAGVDISLDTVFRQLAPLDSVIQSAGRANRYSEKENMSEVYLYDIVDLRKTSNLIYGVDLLIKTENVLSKYETINESNYLELINRYFIEVRKQSDNTSNELLQAMRQLNFSDVNLKLIQEIKTESVFIQLNKKAKRIWEQYVSIYSDENTKTWLKEEKFSKIKSEFYDFVINVPVPFNRTNIIFDSEKEFGFYVSKFDSPSINYNYSSSDFTQNTGYIDSEHKSLFL